MSGVKDVSQTILAAAIVVHTVEFGILKMMVLVI